MNSTKRCPILIVDDRPENLTSLEALLEHMGLELVKAHSGNEALRHTLHHDFALVLLDVQMPEMDGFETAELMRKNPKTRQLPIIFMTAGGKEHLLFQGYRTGAVDYLIKPVEPGVLEGKIRVFCDLFLQRRELERTKEALEKRNRELLENQAKLEEQNRMLHEICLKLEQETEQRVSALETLRQREQQLIHQSRLAALGEMIGNIAHQWRQPLNALGLLVQEGPLLYEVSGEVSQEHLEHSCQKSMAIIQHMSRTIDDFRNFFKIDKEKSRFRVRAELEKTLTLLEGVLKAGEIEVTIESSDDPIVDGYPNEFSHVLLNILTNAKDAFLERATPDRQVSIRVGKEAARTVVTIADNAGGIPEPIISKVFDPYFSTKGPQTGTGVGLFMSRAIIEKNMGGSLTVRNVEQGAEFRIEL
jgi:C4-dicarboxylate-specific signal transduction histidine kinase